MKGYKATCDDMTCRGYQFELGKSYTIDGPVQLCQNGFHFCNNVESIFAYYSPRVHHKMRIFKVNGRGELRYDSDKIVCKTIQLIEELSIIELYDKYNHHSSIRILAAQHKHRLDVLVNDNYWAVRQAVAEQGYGLDILMYDRDADVRLMVARQGHRLDVFVNDPNYTVRIEVAKQGYGLDVLLHDESINVRHQARQQYQLLLDSDQ